MLLTPIVIVGQKSCNFFFLKNEKFHKVQETDLWQKLIFEYRLLDRSAREQRCFSTESFRQQISSSCSYRFLLGAPGEQTAPPPLFHLPIFNPFGFQRSREREREIERDTERQRETSASVYLVVERGHVAGTVRLLLIICLSFKWACGRMGGKMVNKVFSFSFSVYLLLPCVFLSLQVENHFLMLL